MSNILIEANNISKIYDPDIFLKRGKNFYALDNVTFVLEEGDFTCIMGPSGSGKSTLLNCLSTLDKITTGHILLSGTDMSTLNKDSLCQFRYDSLGFVFQNHNLIPYLSIYDNIATPAILGKENPAIIQDRVLSIAKELEIESLLDKFPHECSGGESQRVAIARALVNQPKIIICDEPTGNLDSYNSHKILSILSRLNTQGTTILLVTHDAMIASYAKTMMYLYDGSIKNVIHKNNDEQVNFFKRISEITMQDSLLKEFSNTEDLPEDTNEHIAETHIPEPQEVKLSRQTVYIVLNDKPYDEKMVKSNTPLFINGTTVSYTNRHFDKIQFNLESIQEIHLDLKANFVNFGIFSQYTFYTLMDMVTDEVTYPFMLKNQDDLIDIIHTFDHLSIPLIDPRDIRGAYKLHPREYERAKFFQRTYKDLTEYGKPSSSNPIADQITKKLKK